LLSFRDRVLQEEFDRNGFVVQRMLDAEQLNRARQALAETISGRQFERNDAELVYFNSMFDGDREFRGRYREAMESILRPSLELLLKGMRVFETSLLYKPSESGVLNLHQHVPLTADPFAPTIFCWCALEDTDESNGALKVVPGSHLLLRRMRTLETGEFFEEYREEITRLAVPIRLKAGEGILFENSLLHGAYANVSGGPRPVVCSIMMEERAVHTVYKLDASGEVAVIDDDYSEIQCHTMVPGAPDRPSGRVLRRLPAWDVKPSFSEFRKLLERGRRATEDFDPLAELRAERRSRAFYRMADAILPRIGIGA
jgi:phytanoyl-CoA dioxygenase PhyH